MKIYETINCYENREKLKERMQEISGLNLAGIRFNLSKVRGKLQEALYNIKNVMHETNMEGDILLDLAYPRCKPRITGCNFDNQIKVNMQYYIFEDTNTNKNVNNCIFMENIRFDLIKEDIVLYYADGVGGFKVTQVSDDYVVVKALNSFLINIKKSISFPTPKNQIDFSVINLFLNEMNDRKVYFILAFVEKLKDIEKFRSNVVGNYSIISKIESTLGILNFDEIAKSSEGLLIARGDLAMHADYFRLLEYTKVISAVAKKYERELFCATDILLSLEQNFLPNRAEIIDISINIMMGCDRFILQNDMMNLERTTNVLMELGNKVKK